MDQPEQVSESDHHFLHCPVQTQSSHVHQCWFYKCIDEYQWRKAKDSYWLLLDRWNHCHAQHHDWHSILDIYEGFELWMHLDPVPTHHRFQNWPRYSRNPRFGRINGHSTCFILWIERGYYYKKRQVIWVYSSLVRSSDLKIANQNNNLLITMIIDETTTNYCRSVEDICIPIITTFNRLMFVFKDLEGNIMQLNG